MNRKNDNFDDKTELDLKRKQRDDPLELMRELTGEKESSKRHKKSKKKEKAKDKHKSDDDDLPPVKKSKTIEELRAERFLSLFAVKSSPFFFLNFYFTKRLKRECEERIKAHRLLSVNKEKDTPQVEVDDRKRKYNNQFNPDFSRF